MNLIVIFVLHTAIRSLRYGGKSGRDVNEM